jgi:hypothetical protein
MYDCEAGDSELWGGLELSKHFSFHPEQPTILYFSSDLTFTIGGFSIKQTFETKKVWFRIFF